MSRVVGELVHCTVEHGVATITLDSPANRNALSQQLVAELNAALDRAEQPDVRAAVLTHTPPVFCAGADLKERATAAPTAQAAGNPMSDAITRLGTMRAVTIAAVDGPVRAGGIGLMAACDLVVVNRSVTFALTEVRIGVAPAIISVPILARCGWSRLAAPFLTGEPFDADEARAIGLVTHVTDDVAGTVHRLVEGVLAGAPNAVAEAKRILRGGAPDMAEMVALSAALFSSDEAAEGMRAFAEKRPPRWATQQEGA
ncbi:MAG TPA: enoyl-CoA hydratase [Acidimicrobiaceae bacterium]|nr:enoyl-CoA hydratase [Acidimicrobiaceae bacterium]